MPSRGSASATACSSRPSPNAAGANTASAACPRTARRSAASAGSRPPDGTQAEWVRVPTPTPRCMRCQPTSPTSRPSSSPTRCRPATRSGRARREGPSRRHRRGGRRRRGGPVRHLEHHPPWGALPGHRGRHEQVPAGQGAGLRRDRHRGSRRQHHRRRPGSTRRRRRAPFSIWRRLGATPAPS